MSFDFNPTPDAGSTDPMSDFLQREKQAAGELLGGDQDLFGSSGHHKNSSTNAAPTQLPSDLDDFEQRAKAFPALDGEEALTDTPAAPKPATEEERFQASFPPLDSASLDAGDDAGVWDSWDTEEREVPAPTSVPVPAPVAEATPEVAAKPAPTSMPVAEPTPAREPAPVEAASTTKTPFTYADLDEDTEPLRAWREKQEEEIARREAQAERHRAEAISKAEQEIDQFYADYNAQKEKNIKKNKEAEARFLEQKQKELAEGTTWTRITKLLDLQNSQSKTIAKTGAGASDLTRMKELYLSLRREGEKAPGAAGY